MPYSLMDLTHAGEEIFTYSSFAVMGGKPSNFAPGHMHTVEIGLSCPRCSAVDVPLEHGGEGVCRQCKLHLQRYGNALHVWEDIATPVDDDEPAAVQP